MKKKLLFLIIVIFSFISSVWGIEFDLNSQNAILYNLDEDKILYERNSEEKIAIASMTKIMTAVVALENISSLDQKVILTKNDFLGLAEANASVAGFKVGQRVTYKDLLYGLLLPSGADAAQALVNNIAGSRAKFVQMMNEKAKQIGLENTHFLNETGLDAEGAYSTVKDVANLFKYALNNPTFKEIIGTKKYTMSDNSFSVISTTNSSINKAKLDMDYIIGGKTGTTKKAGKCLASYALYNDSNYILVTARATSATGNVTDAKEIYDYFMSHFKKQLVLSKGQKVLTLNTKNLKEKEINFYAIDDITKYLPNEFSPDALVYDYEGISTVTKDNQKNEKLGTLKIKYANEELVTMDIILNEDIHLDYFQILTSSKVILVGALIIFIILGFIFIRVSKRRKKVKRF